MSWIATHRRQLDQWPNDAEDVLQLAPRIVLESHIDHIDGTGQHEAISAK